MRVVIMLQHLDAGGIQRLAIDDANECFRRGDDVWVVAFKTDQPNGSLAPLLRIPQDHLVRIPYQRMRDLRGFFATVRFLRRVQPDLLMTHQWFANTVGRLAAIVADTPVVLAFEHSTDDARRPVRQLLIDRLLQYAGTKVIAVSDAVRDSLVRRGIDMGRIAVVPNGINLAPYHSLSHAPYAGPMRFVFVGRLIADKGVDLLLEAFAKLVVPAHLTIVGSGPELERLRALAAALGIVDSISFTGTSTNIPAMLAVAGCLVLPSRREGFGLVLVEALAAGIPVIASNLPGIRGVIIDGGNGLIVPVGDTKALADAMSRTTKDVSLYHHLATHARASVEQYSIERHVETLLRIRSER